MRAEHPSIPWHPSRPQDPCHREPGSYKGVYMMLVNLRNERDRRELWRSYCNSHSYSQSTQLLLSFGLMLINLTAYSSSSSFLLLQDSVDFLDLSDNAILSLSNLPRLTRLTSLNLANNPISQISPNLANQLPNLQTLVLSGTQVSC